MTKAVFRGITAKPLQNIARLKELNGYPYFPEFRPDPADPQRALVGSQSVLLFGSNDYLGLSHDPRVVAAAQQAAAAYGVSTCGSRLLNGTTPWHRQLEEELADFLNCEATLVFASGFQANLGALAALGGAKSAIIADEHCHMCLAAGQRLAYARRLRFRHNDPLSLAEALKNCKDLPDCLVVTEGVFSMSGECAPLPELLQVMGTKAGLFLDDAHGIGVLGANGRGSAEHFGVEKDLAILSGTFSKALAGSGGFIAAEAAIIEFLRHYCDAFVFSASLPPPAAAAAQAALAIIRSEPERRAQVLELARYARSGLQQAGFSLQAGFTPVIGVTLDADADSHQAALRVGRFCRQLLAAGFYVHPLLGQAVARPAIRIVLTARHRPEQIDALIAAMLRVRP